MGSGAFGLVWTTAITKRLTPSRVAPPPQLCSLLFFLTFNNGWTRINHTFRSVFVGYKWEIEYAVDRQIRWGGRRKWPLLPCRRAIGRLLFCSGFWESSALWLNGSGSTFLVALFDLGQLSADSRVIFEFDGGKIKDGRGWFKLCA